MIAIGSGQFWGRGLGHGPQSQLNFVPFKHTDFVFAALAEEMGFVGALAVIALFAVILFRAIRIAQLSRDYFGMYLATGIFAFLFFHIFINIGMNLGIVPVTGIPLR
jgi:rod shape determining protein RodA